MTKYWVDIDLQTGGYSWAIRETTTGESVAQGFCDTLDSAMSVVHALLDCYENTSTGPSI